MNNKPRNPKAVPDGIDLRDWFAGLAMQAMVSRTDINDTVDQYAAGSYRYADAMLAERERNHD